MTLPTLVMLPGTLCDARIFHRQKRALRGVAAVRALDCLDLPLEAGARLNHALIRWMRS